MPHTNIYEQHYIIKELEDFDRLLNKSRALPSHHINYGKYYKDLFFSAFRDSLDQIGDMLRSATSLKNKTMRYRAKDLLNDSDIGELLKDDGIGDLGWGWGALKKIAGKINNGVKKVYNVGKNAVKKTVKSIKKAANHVKRAIKKNAPKYFNKAKRVLKNAAKTAKRYVKGAYKKGKKLLKATYNTLKTVPSRVKGVIKNAYDWTKDKIKKAGDKIKDAYNWVKDKTKDAIDWIKNKIIGIYKTKIVPLYNNAVDWMNKINVKLASLRQKSQRTTSVSAKSRVSAIFNTYKKSVKPKFDFIMKKVKWVKDQVEKILGIRERSESLSGIGALVSGTTLAVIGGVVTALLGLIAYLKMFFARAEKADREINVELPEKMSERGMEESRTMDEKARELENLAAQTTDPNMKQQYLDQAAQLRRNAQELRLRSITPSSIAPTPPGTTVGLLDKIKKFLGLEGINLRWIVIAVVIILLLPVILPILKRMFSTISQSVSRISKPKEIPAWPM